MINASSSSQGNAAANISSCSSRSSRERHKIAERERRKSMRELFLSLHSLLPHSNTVRKEQSSILDEIIKYIPIALSHLNSLKLQATKPNHHHQHQPKKPKLVSSSSNNNNNNNQSSSPTSTDTNHQHSSTEPLLPVVQVTDLVNSSDCDIRVMPEPSVSVAIRIRGDRVNVSLADSNVKESSFSSSMSQQQGSSTNILLSAVLDELEAHQLQVVRSTHCRDGNKLLHHSESKVCNGLAKSPVLLKARLQELASKLQNLKKSTYSLKRSFDQLV